MAEKVPLVLLPGMLCDEVLWRHQLDYLADVAEMRVADLTRHDSLRGMAEYVLMSAPPRFALAGLSMGGYVAQEIMRLAPERVLKLALLDTSARADSEAQLTRRQDLARLAERGNFKGVSSALMPLIVHPSRLGEAALTEAIAAMTERVGREAFLAQQRAVMARPDGRADLAAIACPTLVLCGRDDALTPLDLHLEMAAAIAGADLVVLGRCGHLSAMERGPATTGALRAWLAG